MTSIFRSISSTLLQSKNSLGIFTQIRNRGKNPEPKKRNPIWFIRPTITTHEDFITKDNKNFLSEVIHDRYGVPEIIKGAEVYPKSVNEGSLLKYKQLEKQEWATYERRSGVIARKIGVVPLWKKNGKKVMTTMLQVEDNHVIKYYPPDEYQPAQKPRVKSLKRFGCLLVGSGAVNPALLTKAYCGLFKDTGVMPKKVLGRFLVTPNAQILPGTPLNVSHFRVGDFVDVYGKTIDRGFQGVMKRWGFKGQPATHGQTKTHRRPGNIGSGGQKARVWPGQKMPGHMGNRLRRLRGLKIWRINTEHNVMWVSGQNIPGETNNVVYIYDTILPMRRPKISPPFPTCFEEPSSDVTDIWDKDAHNYKDPTIVFEEE